MKAWIVDDERQSAEITEVLLEGGEHKFDEIRLFTDPQQALDAFAHDRPELLFLDIEMPRINGLELLGRIPGVLPAVILTTAYDQFAIEAFRLGAVDYLVKPIEEDELQMAIERALRKQGAAKTEELRELLRDIHRQSGLRKLAIPHINGIDWVPHDAIIRCESDGNYTSIHLAEKKIVATRTLKQIEAQLPEPQFFRVHNSHLVNTHEIVSYQKGSGGSISMSNGDHVPVSRLQKMALLQLLGTS